MVFQTFAQQRVIKMTGNIQSFNFIFRREIIIDLVFQSRRQMYLPADGLIGEDNGFAAQFLTDQSDGFIHIGGNEVFYFHLSLP